MNQFQSRNKKIRHSLKANILRWAQRSPDGKTFSLNMAWAREQFGRNADRMFRSIRQELGVVVESSHRFTPGRRGRSTRYRIGRERMAVVAARLTEAATSADEQRLQDLWRRSNLSSLVEYGYYYTEGRNGDGRLYHAGNSLRNADKHNLRIDNESVVQFDLHNAFPAFLTLQCPNVEQELQELCLSGRLYDSFAEQLGLDRATVKLALNKAFNDPAKVVRFNKQYQPATQTDRDCSLVWGVFRMAFPRFAKWVREMARIKGGTYRSAVKTEAGLRQRMFAVATRLGIPVLDKHDAFLAKQSDAPRFFAVLMIELKKLGFTDGCVGIEHFGTADASNTSTLPHSPYMYGETFSTWFDVGKQPPDPPSAAQSLVILF